MTLPFTFPDWLPWWVPTAALVLAALWVLAFLLVPFSVIGLKSRLDGIEARLDEIQREIRTLTLRLPDPVQPIDFDELYTPAPPPEPARKGGLFARPPIPPASHELEDEDRGRRRAEPVRAPAPAQRAERTEPRLDRPR